MTYILIQIIVHKHKTLVLYPPDYFKALFENMNRKKGKKLVFLNSGISTICIEDIDLQNMKEIIEKTGKNKKKLIVFFKLFIIHLQTLSQLNRLSKF